MSWIRFGTYNLLTGGIDPDGSEKRRKAQIQVLQPLNLDVLALQEVWGWEPGDWFRLYELANSLGMAVLDKAQTQRRNNSASTNWTVLLYRPGVVVPLSGTSSLGTGAFSHGGIRARPLFPDAHGLKVDVDAVHASWTGGQARLDESRWSTDRAKGFSIVIGDMNAGLPTDPQPNWVRIPQELHSRYRLTRDDGSFGDADRRGVGNLVASGFVDPLAQLGRGFDPTTGHWYANEPEPQNLDHILVGAALAPRILDCRVIRSDATLTASDHLPRYLDLAI